MKGHRMAQAQLLPCDLVLKGGIASDIVYPRAIFELSSKYRLSHVGGTSSGAIAAALAAAAEYGRETGGFNRFAALPAEVAPKGIFSQYQPVRKLRALFNMLTWPMGKKTRAGKALAFLAAAVLGYVRAIATGFIIGLDATLLIFIGVSTLTSLSYSTLSLGVLWGWVLFGLVLALVGASISFGLRVLKDFREELPDANYGLISGKRLDPTKEPAVTDWLEEKIELVARGEVDPNTSPLTFGDLRDGPPGYQARTGADWPPIELAMITTDLNMKRPYKLPFQDGEKQRYVHGPLAAEPVEEHFFSEAGFGKLFSDRVMKHLCDGKTPLRVKPDWECPGDLYPFPKAADLPIVVAARMSYGFPFLIQQVPLYKRDMTLDVGSDEPQKCLFSDGGLTSNFPIHLFDNLWPNSPTFGISFDDFSDTRHLVKGEETRVGMATDLQKGTLPIVPITGVFDFVGRLLDVASNWQDNLQSVLHGYRERIVHVHLKPDEGGLNLKMPRDVIDKLALIGAEAGAIALADFNMEEHRWRRFLIAMNEMEQLLEQLSNSDQAGFVRFVEGHGSKGPFAPINPDWKDEVIRRARALVELGKDWQNAPRIGSGIIPKPDCDLRIMPTQ
jgi:predicted acylesterase/phospholipase RssA